jgi:hypothetical protein
MYRTTCPQCKGTSAVHGIHASGQRIWRCPCGHEWSVNPAFPLSSSPKPSAPVSRSTLADDTTKIQIPPQFGLSEEESKDFYRSHRYKKPSDGRQDGVFGFGFFTFSLSVITTLVFVIVAVIIGGFGFENIAGVTFLGICLFILSMLVFTAGGTLIVEPLLERNHYAKHERSQFAERVRKYHDWEEGNRKRSQEHENERIAEERARLNTEKTRQRKLADHWLGLGGIEFERELGGLYRELGYDVKTTPVTGDQGIDLILKKNGLTTIVQCKSHQQPVGPAIAREIYGALVSSGADNAILACTSGFTSGVLEFVKDKPIALVSAKEIVALVESETSNSS